MKGNNLVYSTDQGKHCSECAKPIKACVCSTAGTNAVTDGVVRVLRETKGRKGKGVTLVHGVSLDSGGLKKLAKTLKTQCGVGGAVKANVIELQTADREKVKKLLEQAGYVVKIAGG